jgi:hypothetical protein
VTTSLPSAPGAPLPGGSVDFGTGLPDVHDRVRDGTAVRAARAGSSGAADQGPLRRISEPAGQLSQEPARLGPLDE